MDRKSRAAKTSLVAAFLAAGGAVASTAPAEAASPPGPAAVSNTSQLQWGDQLVRFLKLDGFPAYLKIDGFAQLARYYKAQTTFLPELSDFYLKSPTNQAVTNDLLALYQKADGGPLAGILIGLEQFYKTGDRVPLLDYLKTPGALDAYQKFETFLTALGNEDTGAPLAFDFFYKETGIAGDPLKSTD